MAYDTSNSQTMQVLVDAVPIIRPSGTASPEFMIKMDKVLSSTIKDNEGFAELLWYHSVEERMTAGHASNDLRGTSTVVHSLLVVHLLTDAWVPVLRQKMRSGDNIEEITINRMANIAKGAENTKTYTITYTDSKIDRIEEFPDRVILSIRVKTRTDQAWEIHQDGTKKGNKSADWDYSKAASKP